MPEFRDARFHEEAATDCGALRLDDSCLDQGYVAVLAQSEKRMKFQILSGEETYNYDLPDRTGDPLFAYATPQDAQFLLGKTFTGDGQTEFLDTGKKLYSGSQDYTICTRFATRCDSSEKVLFSCFSEAEPYRGLLVRLAEDNQLDVVVGGNYYTKLALPEKRQQKKKDFSIIQ